MYPISRANGLATYPVRISIVAIVAIVLTICRVKAYHLLRDRDVSGISGLGLVAEAVEFANGITVVAWLHSQSGVASVAIYSSLSDAEAVHGHQGSTQFVAIAGGAHSEDAERL